MCNYHLGFSFPAKDSIELMKIFDKVSSISEIELNSFNPDLQAFANTQNFDQVSKLLREHF